MIASLRGVVMEIHSTGIVMEVQGVGFFVKTSVHTLSSLRINETQLLYIHDHVREDARDLYGFLSWDERGFFERLISVSGVGPKLALTMLSIGPVDRVRQAVMRGDVGTLTSVPGIGGKTAQKIILELKGQLVEQEESSDGSGEVIDALVSLGYPAQKAKQAIATLDPSVQDISERIKLALRYLSP
jgi:Holliday junction DNA helicase RuvA